MADEKISTLPPSGAITGTEEIELNQGGVSVKSTLNGLGYVPLSTKDLANGYVGLNASKEISLSNSIAGAYVHNFTNSNSAGHSYFRTINNSGKEAAIVAFGSTHAAGSTIYSANGAFVSFTAPVCGIVNEEAGSHMAFLVGGTAANLETCRITSNSLKIFAGRAVEFDTSTGGYLGRTALDMIGMFGKTPIVQPTTSVGAATYASVGGNNVQDDDTFDGYSIRQVVKALRNLGILQ